MNNREDNLSKLKYGSYEKIIKAFEKGVGVLYRSDIEILLNRIEVLEELLLKEWPDNENTIYG